jgi:eukaryotic-like serine/threonine-protein kinase
MVLAPGTRLGPYHLLAVLGAGGMGEVYRAHDPRLRRDVAVKVVATEGPAEPSCLHRFEVEARALAALEHPHILAVHDVGTHEGRAYIVCELLEGETLRTRLARGGLPVSESVELARQACDALAAAHARGIVHRDLKPENLFVTREGRLKVLDFGLAKLSRVEEGGDQSTTLSRTAAGALLGTVGYMSPEQARGAPADARSDLFSLGVVLYEMLAGRRAFAAPTAAETLAAILHRDPPGLATVEHPVPEGLERIVRRCLVKDPEKRFGSAREVATALEALSAPAPPPVIPASEGRRWRASIAAPAVVGAILAILVAAWLFERSSKRRWAREVAIPEALRLAEQDQNVQAFELAEEADRLLPDDSRLAALWPRIATQVSIATTPPGASVTAQEYERPDARWRALGQTPIENARIPLGHFRWRIEKPGYATEERAAPAESTKIALIELSESPPGMVRVPGGETHLFVAGFAGLPRVDLDDYWIDRHEVTNREFRAFVAGGGYEKAELAGFRDVTGRPGPATWELGDYPTGQADSPVTGVSWYEAAAYAAFAGKSLPTIYDWFRAAGIAGAPLAVRASNFEGRGLARVGLFRGLGPYGTYDMAGNAREWCVNATGDGDQAYILGGAWNEPAYMFARAQARSRADRSPTNGFRCVKRAAAPPATATLAVGPATRDFSRERPVPEKAFQVLHGLYAYDPAELKAKVESESDFEKWTVERVSFEAAYDGQRVPAYLLLPKGGPPPYQTVVYFPGGNAFTQRTRKDFDHQLKDVDFLVGSGRALMFPIYQGSYERGRGPAFDPWTASRDVWRDDVIRWAKDLSRSIDYLETRPEIDRTKLAYFGVSRGAGLGALLPAVERRLKVAVLVHGGFYPVPARPEVDQINFAPRVTIPVLMLNGRYDFLLPPLACQLPMFQLLGSAEKDKSHVLLDIGHEEPPRHLLIRETLNWLERHLGPVRAVR